MNEQMGENLKSDQSIGLYTPGTDTETRIANNFRYHPPKEGQRERYEAIRDDARCYAYRLAHWCPPSRELSLALTHLEDVVMWANAAIARNE